MNWPGYIIEVDPYGPSTETSTASDTSSATAMPPSSGFEASEPEKIWVAITITAPTGTPTPATAPSFTLPLAKTLEADYATAATSSTTTPRPEPYVPHVAGVTSTPRPCSSPFHICLVIAMALGVFFYLKTRRKYPEGAWRRAEGVDTQLRKTIKDVTEPSWPGSKGRQDQSRGHARNWDRDSSKAELMTTKHN